MIARTTAGRRLRAPMVAILLLAGPGHGWTALVWEKTVHELRIAPLQAEVVVSFDFTNGGDAPVTITDIRTNCDCLAATPDRSTYAPGQRGTIKAHFTTGDRLGLYERAILVATSAGGEPVRLAVKVDVPAPAEVEPRTVDWNLNAPAAPRTVQLVVAPEISLDFTSVAVTGPDFTARLIPIEPGRRYTVEIAPKSTATRASTAVRIRGRDKSGREITVSAYAYIR